MCLDSFFKAFLALFDVYGPECWVPFVLVKFSCPAAALKHTASYIIHAHLVAQAYYLGAVIT